MNKTATSLLFLIFSIQSALANSSCELNSNLSNEELDVWLQSNSKSYLAIVNNIKNRASFNSYKFVMTDEISGGNVAAKNNRLEIQLNPNLSLPLKNAILIFEMVNAYYNPEHQEIDRLVNNGHIKSAQEFGLAHEIYEFEAIRMHRNILIELSNVCASLQKEYFYLVTPAPKDINDYRMPALSTYIETQLKSGHTEHYYNWFQKIKAR